MASSTIWDAPAREAILQRFSLLSEDTRPRWGKMSSGQMLTHCTAALDMLTGRLDVAPKPGPFRNRMLRYIIIHLAPWPKGAPTAPELIMPEYKGDWQADRKSLKRALNQVVEARALREHPAFGKLSRESAGILIWRHLDHHLRQFGL